MIIIGIAGFKGCGKTSFAKALTKHITENCYRTVLQSPFARPLKLTCEAIFGKAAWYGTDEQKMVPAPYWNEKLGEKYSSARRILQTLGTDVFRNTVHKDLWIYAQRNFLLNEGALDVVIIDDIRFDNEADFVRSCNGSLLHCVRADRPTTQDKHASESGVIVKDGDLRFDFNSVAEMTKVAQQITTTLFKKHAKL
jgi:hypothetical protein